MPAYDYRCRSCGEVFEVRRTMASTSDPAITCSQGHTDASRVWSAIAVTGMRSATAPAPATGGGCCGGGCCG